MIKQVFQVKSYWKVIVYWNVDYNFFGIIAKEMEEMGINRKTIDAIYGKMSSGKGKAVTISSIEEHKSIVLFNPHNDIKDYLNSMVHEAEHIKQAMLKAYHVEDIGEPPAYTIGYLVGRMWEVFKRFV